MFVFFFRPQTPLEFVQPFVQSDLDLQVRVITANKQLTPLKADITQVDPVAVGSMVQLETQLGEQLCGVVRYCGEVPGRTGRWVGVEMEEEIRGGGNGWAQVTCREDCHITSVTARTVTSLMSTNRLSRHGERYFVTANLEQFIFVANWSLTGILWRCDFLHSVVILMLSLHFVRSMQAFLELS